MGLRVVVFRVHQRRSDSIAVEVFPVDGHPELLSQAC